MKTHTITDVNQRLFTLSGLSTPGIGNKNKPDPILGIESVLRLLSSKGKKKRKEN